jgi:bifunctional NMN adenylyltransferase/nudix hydrolase
MSKKFDTLVVIGRFQPVHNAHAEMIRRAAALAKQVVIIVGSAKQPRTYKNPFSSREREAMLIATVKDINIDAVVKIEENIDTIYNNQAWAIRIQEAVAKHTMPGDKIGLIGHDKDDTTWYLKMFPQWERVEIPLIEPLNATNVRDLYFRDDVNMNFITGVVPKSVAEFLVRFKHSPDYEQIIRERKFVEMYKKQFAGLAYPPIFVTSDAVVIQSGHVLMIKRRSEPGKGLWALPGGFVNANQDRSVKAAMLRELREETGIKVPRPVLDGSIQDNKVFDGIDRSARGRTITHAFKIVLPDGPLPKVKGLDDAEKAQWIPIAEVSSESCFEDHYEIIQWALGASK